MTGFKEFDRCLGGTYSDGYWSDQGIEQAQKLVRELDSKELNELTRVWATRSKEWQARCAQVLSDAPSPTNSVILVDMVRFGCRDTRMVALDSLREVGFANLTEDQKLIIRKAVDGIFSSADKVERKILEALLKLLLH